MASFTRRISHWLHSAVPLLAAGFCAWGGASCSGKGGDGSGAFDPPGTSSGGIGGDSSSGSGGGAAGSTAVIRPRASGGSDGNGGGGLPDDSVDRDAACAATHADANLRPLDMFMQFDRSGSMDENHKWTQASQALQAFFKDPATAGMSVALHFFPSDSPAAGCTGDVDGKCDVDACGQPLVPLGELSTASAPADQQEALLVNAISSTSPDPPTNKGGTPMSAALAGALKWASAHQADNPDRKTVVVLVTDGQPMGCDEDIDHISALASDAFTQSGVATYAIGMEGADQDQINQIAQAGGTTTGFFVNSSGAQTQLAAALNAIRGNAVSCDIAMPTGGDIDPAMINVNYTSRQDGGDTSELLGQVPSSDECQDGAWYYDDPATPENIVLCPDTCKRVQADPSAGLEVLMGCRSVPK